MIHYNSFSVNAQQDIIITGIAEQSKAGAVVVTDEGQVYYIEGKTDWENEKLHKSRIRVCGVLKRFHTSSAELGYEDKIYKQGIVGEQLILSNADWKTTVIEQENMKQDSLLKRLERALPNNWIMNFRSDTMMISRKEPVVSMFENQINAPINTLSQKEQEERIIKYGKKIYPCFEFLLVPRFTEREIKAIQSVNEQINNHIRMLPKKYIIEHLAKSRKGRTFFTANTDDEKKAVKAYESELEELQQRIMSLPEYHTGLFSLYLLREKGMTDEYTLIHPESASEEMGKIKNDVIARILEKY